MKRFEEATSVSEANHLINDAQKQGESIEDWNISVPQEGVMSIILVFETSPANQCRTCGQENCPLHEQDSQEDDSE